MSDKENNKEQTKVFADYAVTPWKSWREVDAGYILDLALDSFKRNEEIRICQSGMIYCFEYNPEMAMCLQASIRGFWYKSRMVNCRGVYARIWVEIEPDIANPQAAEAPTPSNDRHDEPPKPGDIIEKAGPISQEEKTVNG